MIKLVSIFLASFALASHAGASVLTLSNASGVNTVWRVKWINDNGNTNTAEHPLISVPLRENVTLAVPQEASGNWQVQVVVYDHDLSNALVGDTFIAFLDQNRSAIAIYIPTSVSGFDFPAPVPVDPWTPHLLAVSIVLLLLFVLKLAHDYAKA